MKAGSADLLQLIFWINAVYLCVLIIHKTPTCDRSEGLVYKHLTRICSSKPDVSPELIMCVISYLKLVQLELIIIIITSKCNKYLKHK